MKRNDPNGKRNGPNEKNCSFLSTIRINIKKTQGRLKMKKERITVALKNTIYQYISNNSKEYILVLIIFIIGIFIRRDVYK